MQRVLEIALAEVGYVEGAGNITRYAADLDKLTGFYNGAKNGYPWCDVFVDWCFVKAYGRELAQQLLCQPDDSAGAGCTYSAQYYQRAGRWSTTPQVGAQIFFGDARESTHTGLVYAVDAATVYTVEGNSSDGVNKRQYAIGDGGIYGYGVPDYTLAEATVNWHEDGCARPGDSSAAPQNDSVGGGSYGGLYMSEDGETSGPGDSSAAPQNDSVEGGSYGGLYMDEGGETSGPGDPAPTVEDGDVCTVELPVLRLGNTGEAVGAMQALLVLRGFSVGPDGADGEFGPNTAAGLSAFRRARGLADSGTADGTVWTALVAGREG